jgi:hypothetical protein
MAMAAQEEPSLYMQELTRYLSVNMNSVLLGLPTEIKELIYFDALSHAANMILVSTLSIDVSAADVDPGNSARQQCQKDHSVGNQRYRSRRRLPLQVCRLSPKPNLEGELGRTRANNRVDANQ